jgi:hypothetical protein
MVRVVAECSNERRSGDVAAVLTRLTAETEHDAVERTIFSTNGTFGESAENLQEIVPGESVEPVPFKLDFRRLKPARRVSLRRDLEGGSDTANNIELVKLGTTLEQSTVAAICKELELRFECENKKHSELIVPPTVATAWSVEDVPDDHGGEVAKFIVKVHEAKHVYIVLWSEPPRHYSYLYIKNTEPRYIEFKDSLPNEAARSVATRILTNLKLIAVGEQAPQPSNKLRQADGWSCGLWASRWVERQLRENRQEARLVPTSFSEMRARTNEFIVKVKDAKAVKDDATVAKKEGPSKEYETHEPVHETFEAALLAAWSCTKCMPTKAGTKGCRACMGEHFEGIRQRKARGA